jgi:hypothetical protein
VAYSIDRFANSVVGALAFLSLLTTASIARSLRIRYRCRLIERQRSTNSSYKAMLKAITTKGYL